MPPNYAQDLAERVLIRHAKAQSNMRKRKRLSFGIFGAAASIGLLLGALQLWNLKTEFPTSTQAVSKKVVEAYLWNDEQVTEAELLLILTGEESDETLNYELETELLIF